MTWLTLNAAHCDLKIDQIIFYAPGGFETGPAGQMPPGALADGSFQLKGEVLLQICGKKADVGVRNQTA
jgi:hypothetical protein